MSNSKVKHILKLLHSGELDGIVCVDMLGEGYDFPNLKVAAIHVPHKSLVSTLQFIGRFADKCKEYRKGKIYCGK